ncbi:MAG: antitoxin VapB family protein, partial [Candidatus Methanomethylicaceae archaeon]
YLLKNNLIIKLYIHACAHSYKMTKVISLLEETYKILRELKKNKGSFFNAVTKIAKGLKAKPLNEYAGRWIGNDIDKIFKNILSERETSKTRKIY